MQCGSRLAEYSKAPLWRVDRPKPSVCNNDQGTPSCKIDNTNCGHKLGCEYLCAILIDYMNKKRQYVDAYMSDGELYRALTPPGLKISL